MDTLGPNKDWIPQRLSWLVPIAAFIAVACYFYLPDILFSGPKGLHFIRQSDSLSFATYYHQVTKNFFTPGVLDLRIAPDNGMAAAEFPLIYYLLGWLYEVVGEQHAVLRSINLVIVLIGHILMAQALSVVFKSVWLGTATSIWAFSSSIVVYYSCNFLPDAASYGLVLAGWALYLLRMQRNKIPLAVLITFVLAALFKATMGIHLFALLCLWSVDLFQMDSRSQAARNVTCICIAIALVSSWHAYAIWYNAQHSTDYFLTSAEPIWSMTRSSVLETWDLITNFWWTKYHYPTSCAS